jgi:hypothetical protein
VNEFNRANIHAARRLGGDQHLRRALKLSRHNELLLVAAGTLETRYDIYLKISVIQYFDLACRGSAQFSTNCAEDRGFLSKQTE